MSSEIYKYQLTDRNNTLASCEAETLNDALVILGSDLALENEFQFAATVRSTARSNGGHVFLIKWQPVVPENVSVRLSNAVKDSHLEMLQRERDTLLADMDALNKRLAQWPVRCLEHALTVRESVQTQHRELVTLNQALVKALEGLMHAHFFANKQWAGLNMLDPGQKRAADILQAGMIQAEKALTLAKSTEAKL